MENSRSQWESFGSINNAQGKPQEISGIGILFFFGRQREKNSLKMSGMSLRAIQVNGKRLHSRLNFSQLLN